MTDKPNIPPRKPGEGTRDYRKRISGGTYKNKNKKNKLPSDADIQTKGNMEGQPKPEDIFGEDYEGGPTYLRQSDAFKNRDILKILQQAASIRPYQQVGGSLFKALTIQQLGGYR